LGDRLQVRQLAPSAESGAARLGGLIFVLEFVIFLAVFAVLKGLGFGLWKTVLAGIVSMGVLGFFAWIAARPRPRG
jgi:hypothetical protein